jgi:hypothetical protein
MGGVNEWAQLAEELKSAVVAALPGADVADDVQDDLAVVTYVHPVHQATVLLVLEPAVGEMPASLMAAVVLGDWDAARDDGQAAALLALNPRLMTCAVGLVPLNPDELAVVLSRRLPLTAVRPNDVPSLVDDMIWEYAHVAGWSGPGASATAAEDKPAPAVQVPPRPRLIGSLDEL